MMEFSYMLHSILVNNIAIELKLENQVKGAPDVTEIAHLDCSNSNRKLILTVMLDNKNLSNTFEQPGPKNPLILGSMHIYKRISKMSPLIVE